MMRYFIWVLISFSFYGCSSNAEKTVFDIMFKDASSQFKSVIKEKDTYEIRALNKTSWVYFFLVFWVFGIGNDNLKR